MILHINPQSLIKLSAGAFILIFQMEKLFMADHVGWKLSCDLFQNIRQCNIIKMMDPGGWIFAGACLNGNRSLYILPLKIKMSQHHSAVTGDQQTVPDKTGKLLRNFIQC